MVLIALALWTAGFLSISQASNALWLLFSIALFGIGLGIVMPTVPLWVGDLSPPAFRGRLTSYVSTFSFTGQFLSPIFLSPIESAFGMSYVFLVAGAAAIVLFVIFAGILFKRQQ
jgi:MFS family permease